MRNLKSKFLGISLSALAVVSLLGCEKKVDSSKEESSNVVDVSTSSLSSVSSSSSISSSSTKSSSVSTSTSYDTSHVLNCGHNHEIAVKTPATCTMNGYTTHICLTCGEHVIDSEVSKNNHKYDYEYAVFASSTRQYEIRYMCETCGTTEKGSKLTLSGNKVAYLTENNIIEGNAVGFVANSGLGIKAYPAIGYEFDRWSTGETTRELSEYSSNAIAIFKHKQTEYPILSINLDDGVTLANVKRDYYKSASFEVENNNSIEVLEGEFKGRGNGSWVGSSGKSGYTFKLEKKNQIFGMKAKAKKWNIIANKDDESFHTNWAAYNIATKTLDGIKYSVETKNIEVFINNEFRGIYMLTDAIKAEEKRIPAKSEDSNGDYLYTDPNAGFIIEYDRYSQSNSSDKPNDPSGDLIPIENMSYFSVNGLYRDFSVKYPDPDNAVVYGGNIPDEKHKNAVLNIKSIMNNFSDVLNHGTYEQLCEVVDIDSMIDMYLLHELFKNSDVGWSSFYLYKKPNESKLCFGPAWDFDFAAYRSRTPETSGIHIANKYLCDVVTNNKTSSYNDMFVYATKLKDKNNELAFANNLLIRFKNKSEDVIQGIINETSGNDNSYLAMELNSKKWTVNSYATNLSKLYKWLLDRENWMLSNNFVY